MNELKEKIARAIIRHRYGAFEPSQKLMKGFVLEAGSALRAIEEAGYVVVPREPTPEMIVAGDQGMTADLLIEGDCKGPWVNMLAAAPRNLTEPRG